MTADGFKSITVRERTYKKIKELAREENRSVSNLIDTLIMTNPTLSSINNANHEYDNLHMIDQQ